MCSSMVDPMRHTSWPCLLTSCLISGYTEPLKSVSSSEPDKEFVRSPIIKHPTKHPVRSRWLANGGCYSWGGDTPRVSAVQGRDKLAEAVRRLNQRRAVSYVLTLWHLDGEWEPEGVLDQDSEVRTYWQKKRTSLIDDGSACLPGIIGKWLTGDQALVVRWKATWVSSQGNNTG